LLLLLSHLSRYVRSRFHVSRFRFTHCTFLFCVFVCSPLTHVPHARSFAFVRSRSVRSFGCVRLRSLTDRVYVPSRSFTLVVCVRLFVPHSPRSRTRLLPFTFAFSFCYVYVGPHVSIYVSFVLSFRLRSFCVSRSRSFVRYVCVSRFVYVRLRTVYLTHIHTLDLVHVCGLQHVWFTHYGCVCGLHTPLTTFCVRLPGLVWFGSLPTRSVRCVHHVFGSRLVTLVYVLATFAFSHFHTTHVYRSGWIGLRLFSRLYVSFVPRSSLRLFTAVYSHLTAHVLLHVLRFAVHSRIFLFDSRSSFGSTYIYLRLPRVFPLLAFVPFVTFRFTLHAARFTHRSFTFHLSRYHSFTFSSRLRLICSLRFACTRYVHFGSYTPHVHCLVRWFVSRLVFTRSSLRFVLLRSSFLLHVPVGLVWLPRSPHSRSTARCSHRSAPLHTFTALTFSFCHVLRSHFGSGYSLHTVPRHHGSRLHTFTVWIRSCCTPAFLVRSTFTHVLSPGLVRSFPRFGSRSFAFVPPARSVWLDHVWIFCIYSSVWFTFTSFRSRSPFGWFTVRFVLVYVSFTTHAASHVRFLVLGCAFVARHRLSAPRSWISRSFRLRSYCLRSLLRSRFTFRFVLHSHHTRSALVWIHVWLLRYVGSTLVWFCRFRSSCTSFAIAAPPRYVAFYAFYSHLTCCHTFHALAAPPHHAPSGSGFSVPRFHTRLPTHGSASCTLPHWTPGSWTFCRRIRRTGLPRCTARATACLLPFTCAFHAAHAPYCCGTHNTLRLTAARAVTWILPPLFCYALPRTLSRRRATAYLPPAYRYLSLFLRRANGFLPASAHTRTAQRAVTIAAQRTWRHNSTTRRGLWITATACALLPASPPATYLCAT